MLVFVKSKMVIFMLASTLASSSAVAGGDVPINTDNARQTGEIITGAFQGQGVECPVFRLESGERVTLMGIIPSLDIGEEVSLTGRWARISSCMQGRSFQVGGVAETGGSE